ncbi:hypothetical protein BU17DRAFT_40668 [Hysterangium stoloniferum]|nr:hypothetical protein BU17DRAFT_40668 [Hysterangium stoloniferum]
MKTTYVSCVKFSTINEHGLPQDARHLPPNMKRVGYDTDTERYTFRHGDDLWLGEPGSLYGGKMKWAGKVEDDRTGRLFSKDDDGNESEEDTDWDFSYSEDSGSPNYPFVKQFSYV